MNQAHDHSMVFTLADETDGQENAAARAAGSVRRFNDSELDYAYSEYLRMRAREHNSGVENGDDIGVLVREDWLAAQTALQSDDSRAELAIRRTVILNRKPRNDIVPEQAEAAVSVGVPAVSDNLAPEITVHVYDLPELLAKQIKILSERELLAALADKLKPHLSNAVAGMVRQAVQKKLANLTYDLQMDLNAETPQLVDEILDYHLPTVLNELKSKS